MNKIDYLKEDEPIYGQKYVCISFISPEGLRNTTVRGVKIRGSFDTYEEAQNNAKKLQELDPSFHIFIGEVGKWLPWDPSPDDKTKVRDSMYAEKELQEIVHEYEKNRERAKVVEQERKNEMRQKSLESAKKAKTQSAKQQLVEKKEKISESNDVNNIDHVKKQLDEHQKHVHNKEKEIIDLDENLNKLKDLYDQMQNKNK